VTKRFRIADCGLRIEEKQSGKTSPVLSFPNPKSAIRNPQSKRGFTLIEIVVALGVLAIGITSVFALIATAGATHRKAISQSNAALIADSVFAELRERFDYTRSRKLESFEKLPGKGKVSGYPGFTYELTLTPLDADEENVDYAVEFLAICTVSWKKAGIPVSLAFTTVIIKRLSRESMDDPDLNPPVDE